MEKVKNSSNEDILKTIEANLICAICDYPPRPNQPRWYRCLKLHFICQDCKESKESEILDICQCGQPVSTVHCPISDAILGQKADFKCRFKGCQEVMEPNALERHEVECLFRVVQCYDNACDQALRFRDVVHHFNSHHQYEQEYTENEIFGSQFTFDHLDDLRSKTKRKHGLHYDTNKIEYEAGKLFLERAHLDENGVFHHWIHYVGSKVEAKQFCFTFIYYGKNGCANLFRRSVLPIDIDAQEIVGHHLGMAIPFKTLESQFIDSQTKSFEYDVKIRNVMKSKEVIKDEEVESVESGVSTDQEDSNSSFGAAPTFGMKRTASSSVLSYGSSLFETKSDAMPTFGSIAQNPELPANEFSTLKWPSPTKRIRDDPNE